jgi:hypothetical protein
MNLINVSNIKAVAIIDSHSKVELDSERKESEFPALEEWELAMAGGGEGIVCW